MRSTSVHGGATTGCLVIFAALVVLAAIGSQMESKGVGSGVIEGTGTSAPSERILANGDLATMVKNCDANQVAFEDEWEDYSVRVRGIVKEIDAGFSGGTLRLRKPGGSRWDSIPAFGIDRGVLGGLKKGDKVTLICQHVYESMGEPAFRECAIE
jgi:hypothetical protein